MSTRPAAAVAAGALLLLSAGLATAQPELCPGGNYTAADCPNNNCRAGEPNGCGSGSLAIISPEIVPDEWPGGVDFTGACNAHDDCYATLGVDRATCDQQFLDAMLEECKSSFSCPDVPIIDTGSCPPYDACEKLAQGYHGAISQMGQKSFEENQDQAEEHARQCEGGSL